MQSDDTPNFIESFIEAIGAPGNTVKRFYQDLANIDESLLDDSIVVRILAILATPFRLLGSFLSFVANDWATTRSGLAFFLGAPVVLTLIVALGIWLLADRIYNQARMVGTNQAYFQLNSADDSRPESALAYAKKLVEIDPNSEHLYQLGVAYANCDDMARAKDIMLKISPNTEAGFIPGHIWRATNISSDIEIDDAEASQDVFATAIHQLQMAIDANPEDQLALLNLGDLHLNYASILGSGSPARLEHLLAADKVFREILEDDTVTGQNGSTRIRALRPSVRTRKLLEQIDPTKYDTASEVRRVRSTLENLLKNALRYNSNSFPLWAAMISAAMEIDDFDYALSLAEQGLEAAADPETRIRLQKAGASVLRRAAISQTNPTEFPQYDKRLMYACKAIEYSPSDFSGYSLLLDFIGNENDVLPLEVARKIGLSYQPEPVPINIDWLIRSEAAVKHAGIINLLVGLQDIHKGKLETAQDFWLTADQFDVNSSKFLMKIIEVLSVMPNKKFDNKLEMIDIALKNYPELDQLRVIRGGVLKKEQRYEEAIVAFKQFLAKSPNQLLIRQQLIFCLQHIGLDEEAVEQERLLNQTLNKLDPSALASLQDKLKAAAERELKGTNQ
jgi:tetratricopeptide (TPR) repeat protein